VELHFRDGSRFFSSGHGIYQGSHFLYDDKVYSRFWETISIPATKEEEKAVQRCALSRIGMPFDWRGMFGFLLPYFDRRRRAKYCSSIILDVLQSSLNMFPGIELKISPNGLYKLFSAQPAPSTRTTGSMADTIPTATELATQAQLRKLAAALGRPELKIPATVETEVKR
jgi:hypothetical protein